MSDGPSIPYLINWLRKAATMSRSGRLYRATANALEAERARAEEFRRQRNALDDELTKAQARIAALEAAAGAYADKPYSEELLLELRAVLEKE